MIECGETRLQTEVPSQAPVLPLATTPGEVMGAALLLPESKVLGAHSAGSQFCTSGRRVIMSAVTDMFSRVHAHTVSGFWPQRFARSLSS